MSNRPELPVQALAFEARDAAVYRPVWSLVRMPSNPFSVGWGRSASPPDFSRPVLLAEIDARRSPRFFDCRRYFLKKLKLDKRYQPGVKAKLSSAADTATIEPPSMSLPAASEPRRTARTPAAWRRWRSYSRSTSATPTERQVPKPLWRKPPAGLALLAR
jgi:hypothetical protein